MTQTKFSKPLKFKKSHFPSDDVAWYAKNRKKPIAWSTFSDLANIGLLNDKYGGLVNIIKAYDNNMIILNKEEIEIIQILISYNAKVKK